MLSPGWRSGWNGRKTRPVIKITTQTLKMADLLRGVISNAGIAGAVTLTLPVINFGFACVFVVETTGQNWHIKASASDKFVFDGTALDDGDKITITGATATKGDQLLVYSYLQASGVYDLIAETVRDANGGFADGGA